MRNLKDTIDENDKKRIVKRYYCEKIHGHALAKEEGISSTALGEWVHRYLHHIKAEEELSNQMKIA